MPEAGAGTLLSTQEALPEAGGSAQKRAEQVVQALVLAALFAVPALMCAHAACVIDPDIWWHLRTGEWILAHHAVPQVDPFSGPLAGSPWLAYSWLYELVAVKLFHWLGLAGIVAYSSGMVLAITVAMVHMVRRVQRDFSLAVLLSFAAVFCMGRLYTPRPWLFTILLFILELDILMQARRTGRVRELLWLPLIFALWANVHIEFVDGLMVLGLAWAETLAAHWGVRHGDASAAGVDGRRAGGQRAGDAGEPVWMAHLRGGVRAGNAGRRAEQGLGAAGDSLPRSAGFFDSAAGAGERGGAGVAAAVCAVRDGAAGVCRGRRVPVAARRVGDGRGWRGDSGVDDHRQREGRDPAAKVRHGDSGAVAAGLRCRPGSARCR